MLRTSLLASFLKEAPEPRLMDIYGGDLTSRLRSYSEAEALRSDMVAIGGDMWRVCDRIDEGKS